MTGRSFKLLYDFIALAGGQLAAKVIGFAAFAYLARVVGPASYGAIELAAGLTVFFALIVDCGLGPIGVRAVSRTPERAAALAAHISAARLLIAVAAVPVMGLSAMVTGQPPETVTLVWLFAFGLFAVPWKQDWLLQSREMMAAAALAQGVRMTAFALGVVLFVRGTADLAVVGLAELAAAALWAGYYLLVQGIWIAPVRVGFSWPDIRRLTEQGLAVGLGYMVWAFIQFAPLFLIATLTGGVETGWFGAAHRLVISLLTFSWVYHFNLYPAVTRRLSGPPERLQALMAASLRVTAWGGIGLALVLALAAAPLMGLLFGAPFAAAGPALALLVWAVPVTVLSGHGRWCLIAAGEERCALLAQLAGAAAVLAAGFLLIPRFGPPGAAGAMVLASLVVWGVAQGFAVSRVVSLPGLALLWRPALLAVLCGGLGVLAQAAAGPWLAVAAAGCLFTAGAALVDRRLFPDLQAVLQAKSDL